MPILNNKEYKCDLCGGIFTFIRNEEWNEKIVEQEYKREFPEASRENRDIVCDDCWQLVKPR